MRCVRLKHSCSNYLLSHFPLTQNAPTTQRPFTLLSQVSENVTQLPTAQKELVSDPSVGSPLLCSVGLDSRTSGKSTFLSLSSLVKLTYISQAPGVRGLNRVRDSVLWFARPHILWWVCSQFKWKHLDWKYDREWLPRENMEGCQEKGKDAEQRLQPRCPFPLLWVQALALSSEKTAKHDWLVISLPILSSFSFKIDLFWSLSK